LLDNLSFAIPAGCVVGVIGRNGAGKTTLLNILSGDETPDSGDVTVGESVKLGYVSQTREEISDTSNTVYEEISEGLDEIPYGDTTISTRHYVAGFQFKGAAQEKTVDILSGGERNRVHLAKMLKRGYNVIFLDEPTNDLDIDVLASLESAVQEFFGTAIVVSHDRWFLDKVCTHILSFEGDGVVKFFEGNYYEYLQARKREAGEEKKKNKFVKLGM